MLALLYKMSQKYNNPVSKIQHCLFSSPFSFYNSSKKKYHKTKSNFGTNGWKKFLCEKFFNNTPKIIHVNFFVCCFCLSKQHLMPSLNVNKCCA